MPLGADTVAVVSHSLWVREFGSDPNLVGQTLTLNGMPFTVIGVTPPGFKGTFSLAGPTGSGCRSACASS